MKQERTSCRYGDCDLEKLEDEFKILNKIWSGLEDNWSEPEDIEDVYRIYPLLDTTATLARKRLNHHGANRAKYKVEIVVPSAEQNIDTSEYFYPDQHDFFNGEKKECLLADVVSTFLHASEYVYMDTRKDFHDNTDLKIYVFIGTDRRNQYINVRSYIDAISELIKDEIEARQRR